MDIKSSILDYLGKFEGGIMVLISLMCDGSYHEGIFFYTSDQMVLNVDDKLEEKIGSKIENWQGYPDLLKSILKSIVPYTEMIKRIDDVDFNKFLGANIIREYKIAEEIDPSLVTIATMSNI